MLLPLPSPGQQIHSAKGQIVGILGITRPNGLCHNCSALQLWSKQLQTIHKWVCGAMFQENFIYKTGFGLNWPLGYCLDPDSLVWPTSISSGCLLTHHPHPFLSLQLIYFHGDVKCKLDLITPAASHHTSNKIQNHKNPECNTAPAYFSNLISCQFTPLCLILASSRSDCSLLFPAAAPLLPVSLPGILFCPYAWLTAAHCSRNWNVPASSHYLHPSSGLWALCFFPSQFKSFQVPIYSGVFVFHLPPLLDCKLCEDRNMSVVVSVFSTCVAFTHITDTSQILLNQCMIAQHSFFMQIFVWRYNTETWKVTLLEQIVYLLKLKVIIKKKSHLLEWVCKRCECVSLLSKGMFCQQVYLVHCSSAWLECYVKFCKSPFSPRGGLELCW